MKIDILKGSFGMILLWNFWQKLISPIEEPIKETGHIQILYGNVAPEGSVAKITGKEGMYFSGRYSCHWIERTSMFSKTYPNTCNFLDIHPNAAKIFDSFAVIPLICTIYQLGVL